MKIFFRFFAVIAVISSLSSCAYFESLNKSPDLDYLDKGAKMDIKKFFNGEVEGFAITKDEDDKIIGTQTIKITGKWEENKGVVQQNFVYSDGKKDNRTWLITINPDGTFDAVGHDVSSLGKGKQSGNAAQMTYSLLIVGKKDTKQEMKFEDRIYLIDEKSAIMISNFGGGYNPFGQTVFSLKKN
jgi:Protein of unknown function (DUF3833)